MMVRKKLYWVLVSVFTCVIIFFIPTALSSALSAEPQPPALEQQAASDQVRQAILDAVASNDIYVQKGIVTYLQVTEVKTSKDLQWGTGWVVYYDPQVEALLPSEPALSVAFNNAGQWKALLPSDPGWQETIYQLPADLLTNEEKDMWVAMNQGSQETIAAQGGYYLPWHGGQTAYLSRSVGHDADFSTAHYSFDFFIPGQTSCPSGAISNAGTTGLNFNLYAARAGKVWGWKDSVTDCDHSSVNFIVIQNADDPTLFQLYMHLSQNSIPQALKTVGAPVARGQFIAVADNTGNSTGSHLHFQVERKPFWPADNPYWNNALDITFNDVDINGGRPRVSPADPPYCKPEDICDTFRQTYVSGNYYQGDSTPPIGDITGLTTGQVLETSMITLSGWGYDSQSGLDYGQLKAYFDGAWHNVGPQFNPNFTYTWDLCNPSLPVANGPVSVALLLSDIAGNPAPLVGLRHFTKNYSCQVPPVTCIPGDNQVTLFEDAYFGGGCVKFDPGNYQTPDTLNPLGNDDAESVLVGSNVIATLYSDGNFGGHSQSLVQDMGYMQYQWVASNTLSSLKVSLRSIPPQAPILTNPQGSAVFRDGDVVPFSWVNGGGASEYQLELYLNNSLYKTLPWQSAPVRYVDSLGEGEYGWRVQGRNQAGSGEWSQVASFSVESPIIFPKVEDVPYTDSMETSEAKWARDPMWSYKDNSNLAYSGTHSWWYQNAYGNYDTGQPNSGSLTSPPIFISSTGYYLRFYYRYQTETQGTTWDQRWVQISEDKGKPFVNLYQLSDDPQIPETASWMKSKAIDLSAFAGHEIRIRFQFSTLDASANNFQGWGIDDFSITATPPPACSENRQDDTPAQAILMTYDPTLLMPGVICPNGDVDYYKFYGAKGDRIVADIDAMTKGSLLDSYLFLIDSDGQSVLAENDDEIYSQLRDPLLSFTLPRDGLYYLKLKAWKHPLVSGDNYFYSLRLYEDHAKPAASITWPSSNSYLPDAGMTITAQVSDVSNGVNRVEFYWHSNNWLPGAWEKIGTDRDGSNGWSAVFDPAGQAEGSQAAFYIQVYDMAGNWTGVGAWNLGIDKTAPVTSMKPLATSQPSNAFLLEWTGSDNLSGLDFVEIQESINNGNWTTLAPIDGSFTEHWIIGSPGHYYSYRMHGVDHSGNAESYPSSAEAGTTVPAAGVICNALDSYDSSGDDNSAAKASQIIVDGASQTHNFCNPLQVNFQADEDWVKVSVTAGQHYLVRSLADDPQMAAVISLFKLVGGNLIMLGESVPQAFGDTSALLWTSDVTGVVYIRLRHLDGRVIGTDVTTTVSVSTGDLLFLPLIKR